MNTTKILIGIMLGIMSFTGIQYDLEHIKLWGAMLLIAGITIGYGFNQQEIIQR
jgi:hypothetical protein